MKDRVAWILGACTALLHLAVANRYDLFRDELYFIVCGRHPAFGYVDQPPLVPFLAAAGFALGEQTWVVRLPAVFAAVALVVAVVRFVRLLGGGDGAAWIAGVAAAFAPMLEGLTATLNTTTFEPLAWTLVGYGIARAVVRDDRRALVWVGVAAGVAMEAKYAIPLWLLALAVGLLCTPQRRIFTFRETWLGVGLAVAIALPSVAWQALHGFPFVELVRNAGRKDLVVGPLAYVVNQILVMSPLFAPIWIAGLVAPFASPRLRALRWLAIAFVVAAVATIAGHGKDYYLAAAYPSLFALGGVALAAIVRGVPLRVGYVALATVGTLVLAPMALPILDPPVLVGYEHALHLAPPKQEHGDDADVLPPTFADMLGWHAFVAEIAAATARLTPAERAASVVLVDNYGEAAAIDVYGPVLGVPPARSGHNQYYLWGLGARDPRDLVRVRFHPDRLRPFCANMRVVGETSAPYARDFENGRAIAICRGLHPALSRIWPSLEDII
jgi:hypothetical protein